MSNHPKCPYCGVTGIHEHEIDYDGPSNYEREQLERLDSQYEYIGNYLWGCPHGCGSAVMNRREHTKYFHWDG